METREHLVWRSVDEVLGPKAGRCFGDGHTRVTRTLSGRTDESGAFRGAAVVTCSDDWSPGSAARRVTGAAPVEQSLTTLLRARDGLAP